MSNGLSGPTYDYSDTSYKFKLIQQRLAEIEQRNKEIRDATLTTGASAWKAWSGSQSTKYSEMMDMKFTDAIGNVHDAYKVDPSYTEKGFFGRMFTPAGGRVELTPAAKLGKAGGTFEDVQGSETFKEELGKLGKKITDPVKKVIEATKFEGGQLKTNIAKAAPKLDAGVGKATEAAGKVSEGITEKLGEWAGPAASIYGWTTTARDWDKLSNTQKGGRVAANIVGTAALFNPALLPVSLLASLGSSLIK